MRHRSGCRASQGVLGSQEGLWLCHCVQTATGKRSGKARASVQRGQEETVGRTPGGTSPLGGSAGSGLAGASFGASLPLGAFLAAVTQEMLRLQHTWCSPPPGSRVWTQTFFLRTRVQTRGPDQALILQMEGVQTVGYRSPFQA